jgi:hypothetical protein
MDTDFNAETQRRKDAEKCIMDANRKQKRAKPGEGGDRIAQAFERERGHRRRPPWPLEFDTVWAHVFRCECCGRLRREEQRREPGSVICIRCVRDAGFLN